MPRALWKGTISFGLVTIPVALFPVRNAHENVAFHMLHGSDMRRIHNRYVDEDDHEVPYEEIVKGYEFEKDRYVVIDEADLKAANVKATQTIDIISFVDGKEIDIAFYDTPYYTQPDKAGRKAYALLRETLARTGKVGVAKLVIRERQHLCAVLPDGAALLAYTLRWPYQLHGPKDLDLPGDDLSDLGVTPQETKMAETLVEAMAAPWEPEQYHDTYRDDLLKLIEAKVANAGVTPAPEPVPSKTREAEVVDIMALLKRSVDAQKKKPAARGAKAAG